MFVVVVLFAVKTGGGDLNEELYLIVVVMRVGKILPSDSIKKSEKHFVSGGGGSYGSSGVSSSGGTGGIMAGGSHSTMANYRRPYGVGVLSLADLCHFDSTMETEERDYTIKVSKLRLIFTPFSCPLWLQIGLQIDLQIVIWTKKNSLITVQQLNHPQLLSFITCFIHVF